MKTDSAEIRERLETLERSRRRLRLTVGLLALVVLVWGSGLVVAYSSAVGDTIRAREVVIEDGDGTVRARLGADLPDAVGPDGEKIERGFDPSGLILYDSLGLERGGYVTGGGNILLTLDAGKVGGNRQTAFFVANPDGATALRIWNGEDHVDLRADSDGARFSAARDGEVVFQVPEISDFASTETCSQLRGFLEEHGRERIMEACLQRVPGEACRACLDRE